MDTFGYIDNSVVLISKYHILTFHKKYTFEQWEKQKDMSTSFDQNDITSRTDASTFIHVNVIDEND